MFDAAVRPFWLLLPHLALLACATAPPAIQAEVRPRIGDYAPLKVGASWTYAVDFQGQKGERTVKILREEDGFFIDDQKGALRHASEGLRDKQRFLIRYPLEVGTHWKSILSASAVEHYKILSVGEPCGSIAGTFSDCVVVESRLKGDPKVTLVVTFYWAKGIGLTKIETAAEVEGQGRIPQTTQSLVRYSLNPAAAEEDENAPNTWGR